MNPCTSVRAPRMSYTSTHHDRALTCTYAQISLSCRMPTPREAAPLGLGYRTPQEAYDDYIEQQQAA